VSQLKRTFKGWLELIRPPNLFTVPGDPLAGFILAGGGGDGGFAAASLAASAACLLYMAGLIWNDCADAREDSRTRPGRPIPSGRVRRGHALAVAAVMAAGAVALAWRATPAAGWTALLLTGLILAYNFSARRHLVTGVITMGLCRGASVLLGAAAASSGLPGNSTPWLAAGGITLYIIGVSVLAHGETHRQRLGIKPWLPAGAAALLFVMVGRANAYSAGLAAVALAWLMLRALALRGEPEPADVQRAIGCVIRTLLLLQAGLCALVPETGLVPVMILLAAWPLAALTGRWFYGS